MSFKKTQWPEFVEHMKCLVEEQHNEIVCSLSGRGRFRLVETYRYFGVSVDEWNKMRSDQRKNVVDRFEKAQLAHTQQAPTNPINRPSSVNPEKDIPSTSTASSLPSTTLALSAEDSGIHTIPLITLQMIWSKAESLLNGDDMITPIPGKDKLARAVIPFHSETPHIVRKKGSSQFVCDSNCVQWKASNICSHTVAVSNFSRLFAAICPLVCQQPHPILLR